MPKPKEEKMKTEITKNEYIQLEGIAILARQKDKELREMVYAMAEIIGEELEEDGYGHSFDFIYGTYDSVKKFLSMRDIKIK